MADQTQDTPTTPGAKFMLDKRLNIAAALGFILTACSFMWYAAQADARLATLEAKVGTDTARIATIEGKANSLELVQFRLNAVESTTARIETKLDALNEKVR